MSLLQVIVLLGWICEVLKKCSIKSAKETRRFLQKKSFLPSLKVVSVIIFKT